MLGRFLMSIACTLSVLSLPAFAGGGDTGSDYVAPGLGSILPYRGVYYDRGRGGTGMFLDRSPRGDLFISFYASTEDGAPTYYLMQGMFEPSSDAVRIETGVIGTAHPSLYVSRGGECIEGANCTFQEPTRSAVDLPVEIVWMTPRHATVTIGSKAFDFEAAEFVSPDGADLADSLWLINYGISSPGGPDVAGEPPVRSAMSLVRLHAVSFEEDAVSISPNAHDAFSPPPTGAQWYVLACPSEVSTCAGLYMFAAIVSHFNGAPYPMVLEENPYRLLLWHERVTNRMGVQIVKLENGGVTIGVGGAFFSEVYFDGRNRIVGRGQRLASPDWMGGAMLNSLLMRRMPEGHIRQGHVCDTGGCY